MPEFKSIEEARKYRFGKWGGNPTGTPYKEGYCMASVFSNYISAQCGHRIWKDGYCKQHHPDTIKAKREASEARWQAKCKRWADARLVQDEKNRKAEDYDRLQADYGKLALHYLRIRDLIFMYSDCDCESTDGVPVPPEKKCEVCRMKAEIRAWEAEGNEVAVKA